MSSYYMLIARFQGIPPPNKPSDPPPSMPRDPPPRKPGDLPPSRLHLECAVAGTPSYLSLH